MLILGLILSVFAIGFFCWLLFTLAVYALPFFVAVTVGLAAYHHDAGLLGAFLVAGVVAASACAGAMVFDPYTRQFVTSMRFPKHFQRASKRAS